MANRQHRWLAGQLPVLVENGVISRETADAISDYYQLSHKNTGLNAGLLIFAILGALLIGGGIILLLAYNWQVLSRLHRTVIAFLPLLLGHGIAIWSTATGRNQATWREGTAVFIALAVAAALAIIGQTYNIPGNLKGFIFTWMLLILPVVYLLRSVGSCVIYLAGISIWTIYAASLAEQPILYFGLLALVLPFIAYLVLQYRYSGQTALTGWVLSISLCLGAGISLGQVVPGAWIVVYASLFAILYLLGSQWFDHAPSGWQNPFFMIGSLGITGLTFLLTYEKLWHYIFNRLYSEFAAVSDYNWGLLNIAPVILLTAIAIALLLFVVWQGNKERLIYGIMPVLVVVGFLAGLSKLSIVWPVIGFNIYMLALGAGTIASGIRNNRLAVVNGGMAILTALILGRFFDTDYGLAVRGAAFIVIGIGFVMVNSFLHRKIRERKHA